MPGCCNDAVTIEHSLAHGQTTLAAVADRPRFEASLLLAHVLQKPRTYLIAYPEHQLTQEQYQRYEQALAQRSNNVPLPYITGGIEFFGLDFYVTPDVLIPRPETELLVELALEWVQYRAQPLRIVDVCTGSGCIAVSVAANLHNANVWASDLSLPALHIAQHNAHIHRHPIQFINGDLLAPFAAGFDMILSNPPYVTDAEWDALPPSVQQEPRMALVSGEEGLDAIQRLLVQARERLAPQGCLLMEFGETQGNVIRDLAQTTFPEANVEIIPDLAGKDRIVRVLA